MEVFLILNGYEINATVDEQEQVILALAAGRMSRELFAAWLNAHVVAVRAQRSINLAPLRVP